jgi:hypothetical protein
VLVMVLVLMCSVGILVFLAAVAHCLCASLLMVSAFICVISSILSFGCSGRAP